MAYIKKEQFNNGFSAEYWRLTTVNVNKKTGVVEVIFHGYKDKATRLANGAPIASKKFFLKTSEFDFTKDIFEQGYKLVDDQVAFGKFEKVNGVVVVPEPFFRDAIKD